MDRLFNSLFENSVRLMLLLYEYDLPQSMDMLYVVDFMTLYSQTFGLSDYNLNGDNDFKFSEFASQRQLVSEALRELVLNGISEVVNYHDSISYVITPEGEEYCESLESLYAMEYRKNARRVIKAIGDKSERMLIAEIYHISGKSIRRED